LTSPSSIHKNHKHQHAVAAAAAAIGQSRTTPDGVMVAMAPLPAPLPSPATSNKFVGPSIIRQNRGGAGAPPPPIVPLPTLTPDEEQLLAPRANTCNTNTNANINIDTAPPALPPRAPLSATPQPLVSKPSAVAFSAALAAAAAAAATPQSISAIAEAHRARRPMATEASHTQTPPHPSNDTKRAGSIHLGAQPTPNRAPPLTALPPPHTPIRSSTSSGSTAVAGDVPPPLPPREATTPRASIAARDEQQFTTRMTATPRPTSMYRSSSLDESSNTASSSGNALSAFTSAQSQHRPSIKPMTSGVQTFRRRADSITQDVTTAGAAQGSPAPVPLLALGTGAGASSANSTGTATPFNDTTSISSAATPASSIIRKLQLLMGINKTSSSSSSSTAGATSSSSSSSSTDHTASALSLLYETLQEVSEQTTRLQQSRSQQPTTPRRRGSRSAIGDEALPEELESIIIIDLLAQLYLTSSVLFRHSAIAYALLSYDAMLVVNHLLKGLVPTQQPLARRQAADMLSSLALVAKNPLPVAGTLSATAASNFLQVLSEERSVLTLINSISDADWVVKSNIFGVLGCLTVDPVRYVSATHLTSACDSSTPLSPLATSSSSSSSSFSYSFDAIPRVVALLSSKTTQVREAAINALAALGPVAASAIPDLGELIARDRVVPIRLRAIQALYDIGLQSCAQVGDVVCGHA
jgi:HEAT repeat protein